MNKFVKSLLVAGSVAALAACADAVKGFLAGKGVDAGKVSTVSYGEEKPAVLGHDEAAYSKNRRAVLAY